MMVRVLDEQRQRVEIFVWPGEALVVERAGAGYAAAVVNRRIRASAETSVYATAYDAIVCAALLLPTGEAER